MIKLVFTIVCATLCFASVSHGDGDMVVVMEGDGVDPQHLHPGQNFDVLISLSAEPGKTIDHVRQMQLDHILSSGSDIKAFSWDIEGINSGSYYFEVFPPAHPTVVRANYTDTQPWPGYILNLTDQPNKIGSYNLTYHEPGFLNLLGDPDPSTPDISIRFQSGFGPEVVLYTQKIGNIQGGILALAPEPATWSLLALGGLALLRRRRRHA